MGALSTQDQAILRPGACVDGRYEIRSVVGSGAMGEVYEVRHLRLERTFAMKVMKPDHACRHDLVMRFHREARAAASVGHPNIVDVTDMGQLEDGTAFLVQELLAGRHLADCVAEDGLFSVPRALHVAEQICGALDAVHARRIVHRDLKPENVMLIERGADDSFVKVLDFGICTLLEPEEEGPYARLTRTNVTLGTPLYMAPEQFSPDVALDGRIDIYAVGAILYFLLTGQPLYESRDLRHLCMRVSAEPPPSVRLLRPDVPAELDALIQRACAKFPEQRFQTGGAMGAALTELASELELGGSPRRQSLVRLRAQAETHDSLEVLPRLGLDRTQAAAESQPEAPEAQGTDVVGGATAPNFLRPMPSRRRVAATLALLVGGGLLLWLGHRSTSSGQVPTPAPVAEASRTPAPAVPRPASPASPRELAKSSGGVGREDAPLGVQPTVMETTSASAAPSPAPEPSLRSTRQRVRAAGPPLDKGGEEAAASRVAAPPGPSETEPVSATSSGTAAAVGRVEEAPDDANGPTSDDSRYRIPSRGLKPVF